MSHKACSMSISVKRYDENKIYTFSSMISYTLNNFRPLHNYAMILTPSLYIR